jgi:hypothetical protein
MASMCFPQQSDPFSSAPLSDSEDDDLPSITKIFARAGKAQLVISLTGDDADHDAVVSWQRNYPGGSA